MNVKPRTNMILDSAILVIFLAVAVSGLLLWGLPSGPAQTTLAGLSKHTLHDVHILAGLAMIGFVVAHLAFHWKWITCQVGRLFKKQRRIPNAQCPEL